MAKIHMIFLKNLSWRYSEGSTNYNIEGNLEKFKMIYRFSENKELIVNYINKKFV